MNSIAQGLQRFDAAEIKEHIGHGDGARELVERLVRRGDIRADAGETMVIAEELEQTIARFYDEQYPLSEARFHIPRITDPIDPFKEIYKYDRFDHAGGLAEMSDDATDLPGVETKRQQEELRIVNYGGTFGYGVMELERARSAARGGGPAVQLQLDTQRIRFLRSLAERQVDIVTSIGHPATGIGGAVNNGNVAVGAPAVVGAWAGKTANQVIDDVNKLMGEYDDNANDTQDGPVTLLVPRAQHRKLTQTRMSNDNSETLMQAVLRANPNITEIRRWTRLAGAGAGSTDRAMLYRKDQTVIGMVEPRPFQIIPTLGQQGLRWVGLGVVTLGGTAVFQPLGVRYMDGI